MSRYDLHCLAVETPARPIHIGILSVLDGAALLDRAGRLRLADLRHQLGGRVADVPELRRIVFRPMRLAGRPIWVDDPDFLIDRHVSEVELPSPGTEVDLLALVEQLLAPPLDRSRPLWRMWFVTGLEGGRVGALVVLHHALADGQAAMRIVRSLLEPPVPPGDVAAPAAFMPASPPSRIALVRDNLASAIASVVWFARPAAWRLVAQVARSFRQVNALARRSPVTSLNAPVGPRRRLATMRLDLSDARRVARANGCGVNDVVLSLVTGGVGALLEQRGEPVAQLRPRVGIAVALFSARHARGAGNDIGSLYVPLPLAVRDPVARLPIISAERAEAKGSPLVPLEPVLRAWFARVGAVRRSMEHQRLVNLVETYVPGPPSAIKLLGATVHDLLPIAPLTGNVGLSFVALSYAGRLTVVVRADADRFRDLHVLSAAMERECRLLLDSSRA